MNTTELTPAEVAAVKFLRARVALRQFINTHPGCGNFAHPTKDRPEFVRLSKIRRLAELNMNEVFAQECPLVPKDQRIAS